MVLMMSLQKTMTSCSQVEHTDSGSCTGCMLDNSAGQDLQDQSHHALIIGHGCNSVDTGHELKIEDHDLNNKGYTLNSRGHDLKDKTHDLSHLTEEISDLEVDGAFIMKISEPAPKQR